MYSWLVDLHLEEYLPLFIAAGYDMRTVSKMTPEVSLFKKMLSHFSGGSGRAMRLPVLPLMSLINLNCLTYKPLQFYKILNLQILTLHFIWLEVLCLCHLKFMKIDYSSYQNAV